MKDYKWMIERYNNYIKIYKRTRGKCNLQDLNIDFNECDLYKITYRFKRIDESDIEKYAGVILIKKDHIHYTDEFIKWLKSTGLNIFKYLNMPITFDPDDIKIIEESL